MAVYFFDKNQTLIKIVPESATFEAIQTQELDDDSLLKDTLSVTVKGDEKLLDAEYMAVKSYTGNAQTFDMYRIVTDTTPDKSMSFTGMSLAPYELNGHILQDLRPANHSLSYTLNRVLDGTDWRVGYIDDGLSNVTTTFYYVSAKEALKELQSLVGCEFVFKVEISGQKITDKWVEVYSEMGNRTKKRFNYGTNALTVVRETNKADIYTALIGRGKGEEVSSAEDNESGQAGYGRKITFEDIEWKKSSGKPLDKPKGQYYLELPQATQAYGIKNIDGTMKARVGIVDFDDEEDKNRLINLTYQQLLVSSRPKVLFKTTVANIDATGIGDTVTIHRHDLNIHYQTRVRKIVRNKLNDNKTQIELGDAVVTPSTKQFKQNNATIKNLNQEIEKVKADVTVSQTSADGKNTINYGSAEPERKRTGDTWYRPHPSIAGETQMLVWDGNAWELVIDTSDLTSVSRAVEDAADQADEAVQAAKDSDAKAEAIKQGLGLSDINLTNQQITDQIMSDYNTVKQNSTNALSDAGKALTDAYNAQQDADKIIEDFEAFLTGDFAGAENDIATAQSTATDALSKAGTAVSDLDTFKSDYNTFITDQFNPAFTAATDALSLAEQNEGLFYSANLIDEVTGMSNVYTKSEIDGTNGYVTKSTFNANAESISSELERVEGVALASGANINLLVVKNAKNNTWLDTNPSSRTYPTPNDTNNATATSPDLISVTAGEKITLSKTTVSGDNNFRIDFLNSSKAFVSRLAIANNTQTITIPANVAYMWVSYPMDSYPKIERGEIKTQWTLAPQDQVNQSTINYFTSKINQTPELISEALLAYTPTDSLDDTVSSYLSNNTTKTAKAIDTKLTSYAKTTDLNGLATETFATNKATETANGVKRELVEVIGTKVDADTLDGYVSTATYDEDVKGISRSISTVEGKIPTAIGGRNLLRGTANFNTPLWRNVTTAIPSTRDSRYKQVRVDGDYTVAPITTMSTQQWNFEVGEDYVVSVYAKSEVLGNKLGLTAQSTIYFEPQVVAVSEWKRYVWKFKATISNLANFRFETRNGERVWITQPQVEKGTILTDWTLAPEDLQTIDALDSNIVSLYNNTTSETSKAFSRTLTAYTPTNGLDDKTKNYLTNNNYQTAEMVETKLTAYTPTNSLDNKTQAYLTSKQYQTASEVSTTLEAYTKTNKLDNTVASYLNSSSSQTAEAIASKLSAYTTDESFNAKTQSYLTNNSYQTASQISTTLESYTKTTNLDKTVASYLDNSTSQTAQYINTKLSAYTTNESFNTKTQSYLTNNSYQTAGMVENKLASYQTKTTLDGSVASILDNTESQTAGKINSKLTDIQAQIPTEFGGRNLLRGTADFDTTLWRNVSTAIPSSRDSRYKQVRVDGDYKVAPITSMATQGWNFEVGEDYVVSVYAKSEKLGNKIGLTAQSSAIYFEPQVVTLSKWSRYTWTFTATMSNLTNFRFETRNGERVWITQPQIEKGSIPTDWTRAVEDLATVVQTNEIERTANYTKSAIANVTKEGLVTGSTVNQSKDGITERVARLDTNGNVSYTNRDVKLDSIVSTVANDKYISNIIQASDLVQSTIRENTNVDLLAKSASGTGMTADPTFNKGINGLIVYDSGNTNTISIYRNLTNDPNLPSGKGYRLDIYHASSTATSPQRGGVALPTRSWANGVVVVRFTARLDVGKNFVYNQNSTGTGSTHGWLTSNKGTGKWEQYAYYHRFGTTGTFQTFGFISVNATSASFTWYLSEFDIINLGLSSQSQITQLADNINLKVSNADLLNQINVQAEGVLITSGTNKLNVTPETTYIEDSTIKSAMIESLEADKIKTGTLDAGKVKVINIDAENITSNVTDFIKSNWNEATGGGVTITGSGVRAINSEGSRVTLENGVVSVGNRAGVNLGFFGDHILNKSSTGTMTITASHGTETAFISATGTDGKTYKRSMSIMAGAGEIDMFTTLDMNKNSLKDVTDIGFTGGLIKGNISGSARYMTIEAGTGTAFDVSGTTRMSITSVVNIFSGIDMKGNDIASVGKLTYNSDQRLKTNIKDTNIRALDAIRNWKLVSYNWLESGEHIEIGLIAQNSPEVMTYNEENDIYGIDAGKQTMINTLGIQQLDSKVDNKVEQLEAKIASLQEELATLKGD